MERMNAWMNESMNEWTNEQRNEWLSEFDVMKSWSWRFLKFSCVWPTLIFNGWQFLISWCIKSKILWNAWNIHRYIQLQNVHHHLVFLHLFLPQVKAMEEAAKPLTTNSKFLWRSRCGSNRCRLLKDDGLVPFVCREWLKLTCTTASM